MGWRVDDAQGRRVGTFVGTYADERTDRDAWFLVRLQRFSARYVLVPPADALVAHGRLTLPYTRETIESSPLLYSPPERTTTALEEQLERHYRLLAGRDREPSFAARRHAGAGGV
ncbi:MAG TPA: hypothetical protein VHB30_09780 [Solirubrobacteraceae bacterium]|nr:hypothetical protein [Solirubrobacteraceae bacterium]